MERKELVNQIEVNFYDFGEFEYYALVLAENQENAIKGYTEVVADIEDEELEPRIITIKEALEKYKKAKDEKCESEKEKVEEFYISLREFRVLAINKRIEYLVMLIDGSLL
ncbi:hypothetical protein [Clostridium perfringens]|uniref:hypothetical protein n=1 Tax=Clostridium perfringens TaxID=1502 RepID=UPI001CC5093E|nr:hypothetical protein [Clostridium perfringens]EJT5919106.1 hypothetical protein [Clostridium perfringens]